MCEQDLPDVRIVHGLFTSLIIPVSHKGRKWIIENLYRHGFELTVTVQTETLESTLKSIEEDGLIVE